MYEVTLECATKDELRIALKEWGRQVPDRPYPSGQQDKLEKWVLRRFIEFQSEAASLEFPISVFKSENPDFFLRTGTKRVGIEIAEACNPDDQRQLSQEADEDKTSEDICIRDIDLADPGRKARVQEMMRNIFVKKTKNCTRDCDQLLLYLNTVDASFEDPKTIQNWLQSLNLPQTNFQFEKVFVLTDTSLYQIFPNVSLIG